MATRPVPSSRPEPTAADVPCRAFNRLVASNLAAQSAEQLSLAAVPIVAVLALGAGPGEIGLLATAQTLPFLLLSIPLRPAGRPQVAPPADGRLAEALRALSLLRCCWRPLAGQLSLAVLAVLGFVGAVGTVGFSVAAPALVPALVPREALGAANSRLELARSAAFAAGPALAGALVAWAGAAGGLRAGRGAVGCGRGAAAAPARAAARAAPRRAIRCWNCATARGWSGSTRCCGPSC